MLFIPADRIRQQSFNILRAWGQSEAHANITADILTETDLRPFMVGRDSGAPMLDLLDPGRDTPPIVLPKPIK
jgi:hypothetical protein